MRRFALSVLVVLVMIAAAYGPRTGAEASRGQRSASAKKVCRTVEKKVHGRLKKVKVCTTVHPTPTPTFPPTLTPTPVDVQGTADGIADDVTQAQDPDDRYHAVLEAMQQLNVGVYSAEGGAVNRGGETNDADLYTYDFELRGISQSIDANRAWGMDDVARILQAENIRRSAGQPFDAQTATALIEASVRSAMAEPHNPTGLSFLLLRALGLRHTAAYDHGQDIPADQIHLDALQLALVILEFNVPLALKARAAGSSQATGGAKSPGNGELCGDGISGLSSWLFPELAVTDNSKDALPQLVGAFHQTLLGVFDVQVQASAPAGTSTQYGTGGQPGQPLRFVATVWLLSSPEEAVQCGVLSSLNLPGSGPIASASIVWDSGGLEKYGSVTYLPAGSSTGKDGSSTLVFQPKDDTGSGGAAHTVSGTALARVTSLAGTEPSVKTLLDLASLSPASFNWQVTYHGSAP